MSNTGRIIVSLGGITLTDAERDMLQHPMLAGIILFTRNYKDKAQLKSLVGEIQSIADLPIFVDQEGGRIQRFSNGFTALPASAVLGQAYEINKDFGLQMSENYGAIMAEELAEFGIISLAPVCDLDAGNAAISFYDRALHTDPKACTDLLFAYTKGMQHHGMPATGKHFPGHGQDIGDTHYADVKDTRSLQEIEENDLVPFIKLIEENKLAAIMPAHIVYDKVDADHTAGASKIWLQELLRDKYGFKGVIVSDCLSMKGSGDHGLLDKTKEALNFGDVALICNQSVEEFNSILNGLCVEQYGLDEVGRQRISAWVDSSAGARAKIKQEFLGINRNSIQVLKFRA